jgi:T5SS/PEP-CTERM-associated repeat protein
VKVRQSGRIVSVARIIALGVNSDGRRRFLTCNELRPWSMFCELGVVWGLGMSSYLHLLRASTALGLVSAALPLSSLGAAAAEIVIDNGVPVVVQSPTPLITDKWLFIGETAGSQSLTVQNNGLVQFRFAEIGNQSTSNNNLVTVTGPGSLFENVAGGVITVTGPALLVGDFGSGNRLLILNGGSVKIKHVDGGNSPDDALIGYRAGANNNNITVTGAGSTLSVAASTLLVGYNSNVNSLDILNGGQVSALQMRVGGGTNSTNPANNNSVLVDGTGSLLTTAGTLNLGANGAGGSNNTLTVRNGAIVSVGAANSKNLTIGQIASSNNNKVVVTGPGSQLTAFGIVIGNGANQGNTIEVSNGARINSQSTITFNSNSLYRYGLGGAQPATVVANGPVTIGANVTFAAFGAPGSGLTNRISVLHGSSITGTFGTFDSSGLPSSFVSSLSYTPTDVLLNLNASLGNSGGLNGNQQGVANGINNFFNGGGTLTPNFLTLFGLSGSNLASALSQLSGEVATVSQQGAFQLSNQFLGLMIDPFVSGRDAGRGGGVAGFAPEQASHLPPDIALAYASVFKAPPKPATLDQRWNLWGAAFGGVNQTNGDPVAGTNNVSSRAYGFASGIDYRVTPDTVIGFALAGGGTNWSLAQGLGSGRSDAFQAGVYGRANSGPAYLAASFAFSNYGMSTDRFALAGNHLTASFNAQSYGGRIEAGYRVGVMPTASVTPYLAAQVQAFRTPAYNEIDLTAGGFGLGFAARNANDTRSEIGFRFDDLTVLNGMPLILRARAAWAHDWVTNPSLTATFQALPGSSFIVNGASPARDSALTTASAELRLTTSLSLLAKFDGEFARSSQTYAGTGAIRYVW